MAAHPRPIPLELPSSSVALSRRARGRASAIVRFTDSTGVDWQVLEIVQQHGRHRGVRPGLANGWLCFENANRERVRLGRWSYPKNWRELSTDELEWLLSIGRISDAAGSYRNT